MDKHLDRMVEIIVELRTIALPKNQKEFDRLWELSEELDDRNHLIRVQAIEGRNFDVDLD